MNPDTSQYVGAKDEGWSVGAMISYKSHGDIHLQSFQLHTPHHKHKWDDATFWTVLETSMMGCVPGIIPRLHEYVNGLNSEIRYALEREYAPYHLDIMEGILVGLAAYVSFLWLNEHHALPWYNSFPGTIEQGNIFNRNMFQVVACPLLALLDVCDGGLGLVVRLAYSFVNLHEDLFYPGPEIALNIFTTISVQTITGITKLLTKQMCQIRESCSIAPSVLPIPAEVSCSDNEVFRLQQMRLDKLEQHVSECHQQISDLQGEISKGLSLASDFSERSSSANETPTTENSSLHGWRRPRYQISRY